MYRAIELKNPRQIQKCREVFDRQVKRKKPNTIATTGNVFMEAHNIFTENHQVLPFKYSEEMQKLADNWCAIQKDVDCDMVYPLDVAFNAALVPSTYCPHDVVQFWYNQRRFINPHKTMFENVMIAQEMGVEIVGYLNIISNYPDRQLGCCQVQCQNKHHILYGCAYGKQGFGYWTLQKNNRTELNELGEAKIYNGYYYHTSDIARVELPPVPKIDLLKKLPQEEYATFGCSAHVMGNGPTKTILPFRYYCHYLKPVLFPSPTTSQIVPAIRSVIMQKKQEFLRKREIEFGSCWNSTLEKKLPLLLYCDPDCGERIVFNPKTMKVDPKSICVCAQAQVAYYELEPPIPLDVYAPKLYEVKSAGNISLTLEQDFIHEQECQEDGTKCNIDYRFPSQSNPWIFLEPRDSTLSKSVKSMMLLENSLCQNVTFTVNLSKPPEDEKPLTKFAVLAHYVNPLTYLIFIVDISLSVATVKSCRQDGCATLAEKSLGQFSHKPMTLKVICKSKMEFILNKELITSFAESKPNVGFFGIGFDNYEHTVDFLDSVELNPINEIRIRNEKFDSCYRSTDEDWLLRPEVVHNNWDFEDEEEEEDDDEVEDESDDEFENNLLHDLQEKDLEDIYRDQKWLNHWDVKSDSEL